MYDIVVIGGGQAGLAVGQALDANKANFLIVDSQPETGWVWRQRYGSLKLFTPSQYSNLPGMPLSLSKDSYPTKDQIANYLQSYAGYFHLPIRHNVHVEMLTPVADGFLLETNEGPIRAKKVVVATGKVPWRPVCSDQLGPDVLQLHSSEYKSPSQIPEGAVAVVGGGNSGAQIAEELAETHKVSLSYEILPKYFPQRWLGKDIFFWLILIGVMIKKRDPERPGERAGGAVPRIGGDLDAKLKSGVITELPGVESAGENCLYFKGGKSIRPRTIIWSTGFRYDFDWIKAKMVDDEGLPLHLRGVSPVRNLFYIGLTDQYRKSSGFLGFLHEDVNFLISQIKIGQ